MCVVRLCNKSCRLEFQKLVFIFEAKAWPSSIVRLTKWPIISLIRHFILQCQTYFSFYLFFYRTERLHGRKCPDVILGDRRRYFINERVWQKEKEADRKRTRKCVLSLQSDVSWEKKKKSIISQRINKKYCAISHIIKFVVRVLAVFFFFLSFAGVCVCMCVCKYSSMEAGYILWSDTWVYYFQLM